MAKRLISKTILSCNNLSIKSAAPAYGNIICKRLHTNEKPVKEIQIPVRWGHISAKLWGNTEERPILAVHGWQDNCGTWDPLIPMLSTKQPILAIDLPGHGLSSWIPPGMHYYAWEFPRLILYLKDYFQWDKVSLLSHSMGAIASSRFASLFPDDVDFYIAIDSLIYDDYDLNQVIKNIPLMLRKIQTAQARLQELPPTYTLEEISKIWHMGTSKSIALESVPHLIKRGVKQSQSDPDKYYFSRDSRLKHIHFNPEDKKFVETLIKRLKCPTLYVKAIDSPYASDEYSVEMREVIEKNNVKFECQFIPGTHHVHLNNPERVAPLIDRFLGRYNLLK